VLAAKFRELTTRGEERERERGVSREERERERSVRGERV
jgi:hypothetical protein